MNGHVCTTDLSIIKNERIKYLGLVGLKFREEITEDTVIEAFETAVKDFVENIKVNQRRMGDAINEELLTQWKKSMIKEFKRK